MHCNGYSGQNYLTSGARVSGSARFSDCTTCILYRFHFELNRRTFHSIQQKKDKSFDIARALVEEYCESDAFSSTARAISPAVQFKFVSILFLAAGPTPQSISNLGIIFFLTCASTLVLSQLFKCRYPRKIVNKLLPF